MKTFREFMVIAEGSFDSMSDADFERWVESNRGRGTEAIEAARRRREQKIKARTVGGPTSQGQPFDPTGRPGSPGNSQGGYATNTGSGRQPPGSQPPTGTTPPPSNPPTVKPTVKPKIPGLKSGAALSGVFGAADEKMKGSGNLRALAKGATMAVGTVLGGLGGGALGSLAGPTGTGVGGYLGQAAGAYAADKAFDTVAGANAVTRKAMATANRQRQAGGGLAGIGGQTTFSKGKDGTGFMSTGVGNQRKTVQLAKTSVVKDPKTGKLETGNLAFKGGKAVYKRAADPSTLAQTSSNPLERVGRSLFAGAYKDQDEKARQSKLKQAAQSDIKRQQALGVKGSQNLVGPKIVGPKIVGPKPTPSKPAGGGMGGRRGAAPSPGSIKTAPAAKPKPVITPAVKPAVAGGGMGGRRGAAPSPGSIKK